MTVEETVGRQVAEMLVVRRTAGSRAAGCRAAARQVAALTRRRGQLCYRSCRPAS